MYNSWVEISKSAILHNLSQFQKLAGEAVEIMPIVKSNAYGHGLILISKLISKKVKWLGVVSLGEALALRKQGIKNNIFVLSYVPSRYLKEGINQRIDLPLYDLTDAKIISQIAGCLKKKAFVHIKVDTGCGRIGVMPAEAVKFVKAVKQYGNIEIRGIFSHFASSEENAGYTRIQLARFNAVLDALDQIGINIPYQHIACSAAILIRPEVKFNFVRLGLGLYGLWPSARARQIAGKSYPWLKLRPALTWKTKIIQIKTVSAGGKIGYGGTYVAKHKLKLAVLSAGYWEGYDRKLSNAGIVLIKNKKCPIIGRICMNLMMADVSKVKDVKLGDDVILLGMGITADDLADQIGTINYEVVTRINPLLPRILKN